MKERVLDQKMTIGEFFGLIGVVKGLGIDYFEREVVQLEDEGIIRVDILQQLTREDMRQDLKLKLGLVKLIMEALEDPIDIIEAKSKKEEQVIEELFDFIPEECIAIKSEEQIGKVEQPQNESPRTFKDFIVAYGLQRLHLPSLQHQIKTQADLEALDELLQDKHALALFKSCNKDIGGYLFKYLTKNGISYEGANTGTCYFCCTRNVKRNWFNIPGDMLQTFHCSECHEKADIIRKKRGLKTIAFRN